jgi:hypothetical protein
MQNKDWAFIAISKLFAELLTQDFTPSKKKKNIFDEISMLIIKEIPVCDRRKFRF